MTLRNLKIIAAIVTLIVIGLVVERFWTREESPPPINIEEINFDRTGHLVWNNPGLKPNTWFLVYELAGQPALNIELAFDGNSSIFVNDKAVEYREYEFTNGQVVHVEGVERNQVVTVRELIVMEDIEPAPQITVKLYYYNPDKDKDTNGNILASRRGLVAVDRQIPVTKTPIQDTIKLLLQGNLTSAERAQGITTEYPLPGVELKSANLKSGVLTLEFADPQNKTGGGSARVGVLWFQIEATAKQFPGVSQVKFKPEELFQP